MLGLIRHPVIVAVILFCITYATLYLKESKRLEKDSKAIRKQTGYLVPGVVSVLGYLIAYKCGSLIPYASNVTPQVGGTKVSSSSSVADLIADANLLIGKGNITLPQPDIFIELADF